MKQRKKAERLARKHAAQETSAQKVQEKTSKKTHGENPAKDPLQEQFDQYRRVMEQQGMWPGDAEVIDPYPIGELLPVRG